MSKQANVFSKSVLKQKIGTKMSFYLLPIFELKWILFNIVVDNFFLPNKSYPATIHCGEHVRLSYN